MKKTLILIILLCIVSSCGKRDLCYLPHPHTTELTVVFDWKNLLAGSSTPENMLLYMYPSSKDDVLVFHINGNSKTIIVPQGTYKTLVINDYTQNAHLKNMENIAEDTVYVDDIPTTKADNKRYITPVEMLHASADEFVINGEDKVITIFPKPLTYLIKVIAEVVSGGGVTVESAEISGLSASANIAAFSHDRNNTGSQIFDLTPKGDKIFEGQGYTLGACPDIEGFPRVVKTLTLHLKAADGYIYTLSEDVSDIVNSIKNNTLTIKAEVTGSPEIGFEISVSEYKNGDDGEIIVKTQTK